MGYKVILIPHGMIKLINLPIPQIFGIFVMHIWDLLCQQCAVLTSSCIQSAVW
jgi:hypothetical protein